MMMHELNFFHVGELTSVQIKMYTDWKTKQSIPHSLVVVLVIVMVAVVVIMLEVISVSVDAWLLLPSPGIA